MGIGLKAARRGNSSLYDAPLYTGRLGCRVLRLRLQLSYFGPSLDGDDFSCRGSIKRCATKAFTTAENNGVFLLPYDLQGDKALITV